MDVILGISLMFFLGIIWLLPFILLINSKRTEGKKKFLWLLIMIFISWFAWLLYIALVPKKEIKQRFRAIE